MTGDLDMDAYGTGSGVNVVKWGSGTDVPFIYPNTKTDFRFVYGDPRTKGSANYASLNANILNMYTGFKGMTGRDIYVRADDRVYFQTLSATPTWVTCLDIDDEECKIPRAGNITLLAGRTLDSFIGNLLLPNYLAAAATLHNTRYNASTDTFEIYDGAAWQAH